MTLLSIMGPVFTCYKEKLVEVYDKMELRSEVAKGKMLKDAELFQERLGKLEGCGTAGEVILETVKSKKVVDGGATAGSAGTS